MKSKVRLITRGTGALICLTSAEEHWFSPGCWLWCLLMCSISVLLNTPLFSVPFIFSIADKRRTPPAIESRTNNYVLIPTIGDRISVPASFNNGRFEKFDKKRKERVAPSSTTNNSSLSHLSILNYLFIF